MTQMLWSDDRNKELAVLRAEGLSVARCAERMGFTKGQISGRLFRMETKCESSTPAVEASYAIAPAPFTFCLPKPQAPSDADVIARLIRNFPHRLRGYFSRNEESAVVFLRTVPELSRQGALALKQKMWDRVHDVENQFPSSTRPPWVEMYCNSMASVANWVEREPNNDDPRVSLALIYHEFEDGMARWKRYESERV